MQITLHQTHHQVAEFKEILSYLRKVIDQKPTGLHLFCELFMDGYPLQDLCLQKSFITSHQELVEAINSLALNATGDWVFLLGGIDYELSSSGLPIHLRNVMYELRPGKPLRPIYIKRLLPNYDIFDEQKYFTPGQTSGLWECDGKTYGILICEDMWASSFHQVDPCQDLYTHCLEQKISLDGIFNISASPFVIGKKAKRIERAKILSRKFKAPFYYVNRVGGEDEILFDGSSFICDGVKVLAQAESFSAQVISVEEEQLASDYQGEVPENIDNTWEQLFEARIERKTKPCLEPWSDETCSEVLEALKFGVQQYASRCGFNRFSIALSGGIDSSLVLTILKLSLKSGQYLEAIYMPSIYSKTLSYELSRDLCQKLEVPLITLPIKFLHSTTKNLFQTTLREPFEGLTDENVQSRLRGMLLYTRSNQIGSMVINTSNKSELAVGYSTQYGDSVGAISLLGDIFKSQVYRLAEYINQNHGNIIPEGVIERAPTAELREGQVDAQTLPPYDELDPILEGILSYRHNFSDLTQFGFDESSVKKVFNLYRNSEFKRFQFAPIIKISSKSFGFGYRIPISKASSFYTEKIV